MDLMKEKLRKNSSLDTTIDSIDPDSSFIFNEKESPVSERKLARTIPALILTVDTLMYAYSLVDY